MATSIQTVNESAYYTLELDFFANLSTSRKSEDVKNEQSSTIIREAQAAYDYSKSLSKIDTTQQTTTPVENAPSHQNRLKRDTQCSCVNGFRCVCIKHNDTSKSNDNELFWPNKNYWSSQKS